MYVPGPSSDKINCSDQVAETSSINNLPISYFANIIFHDFDFVKIIDILLQQLTITLADMNV